MTIRLLVAGVVAVLVLAGCDAAADDTTASTGAAPTTASTPDGASTTSTTGPTEPGSPADAEILLQQMANDMQDIATGFRAQGTYVDDGKLVSETGSKLVTFDVQVQGGNGQGTLTYGTSVCELRGIDHAAWAKAPAAFWTGFADIDPAVAARIADRWVVVEHHVTPLRDFVDQTTFFDELANSAGDLRFGRDRFEGGLDAREVLVDENTFVIGVTQPHLLLSLTGGSGTSSVTYPEGGLQVEPPPSSIDLPS